MSFRWLLVTSLALGVPLPAQGEDSPSGLSVGARVRLTAPSLSARPLVGKLVREQSAVLEIAREDGSVSSIPIAKIAKLQVSSGKKRKTLLGAFCGAALGVGIALYAYRCQHPRYCEEDYRGVAAVVFGGGGAAVGALVGSEIRTERWTTVPIPAARSVSGPSRTTLSFTLRF
jgi:hypothetical protein